MCILLKIENRNLVMPMTGLISWAKAEDQAIAPLSERRQFQTAVSLFIKLNELNCQNMTSLLRKKEVSDMERRPPGLHKN